jgi:UDP-N-acetylglucosamine acyltransferase
MTLIHPTALIDPQAELAPDVTVGPYTVIGPNVRVGERTTIGPHCVIEGHTTIGNDNRIFQFSSLGAMPQDKKYAGEPTRLDIGHRNTIREFCTFNLGTAQDGGVTRLGDDNWMMAYTHLAHDCQVGNHTIFANNAQIAGHVHVGDWVILGAYTAVHQFVKIGPHAMTAMGTILLQDVPPFTLAAGSPAQAKGINLEGLKRRGFSPQQIAVAKQMHRALYRQGLSLDAARVAIAEIKSTLPEAIDDITMMLDFLSKAQRGIVR